MTGLREEEQLGEEGESRVESASAIGCELRSADPGNDQDERYLASASVKGAVSTDMKGVVVSVGDCRGLGWKQ